MKVTIKIWRQSGKNAKGSFAEYPLDNVSPEMSFLEMLDVLNESLETKGQEPVAFEHDCREGICGCCSMVINGEPHGPHARTTTCQVHMRSFKDGETIVVEPWRAKAFPVLKDLIVDRSSFDRIVEAGGYISVNTGSALDANLILIGKDTLDKAMDAAECIGCGACVAACPNGSAMLFTAAKASHLNLLPQGQPEKYRRVRNMLSTMEKEGFGSCTNYGECQEACPKSVSLDFIARLNKDYIKSFLVEDHSDRGKLDSQ